MAPTNRKYVDKSTSTETNIPSYLYVIITILILSNIILIYFLYTLKNDQKDVNNKVSPNIDSRPTRALANASYLQNPVYRVETNQKGDDEISDENNSPLSDIDFSNNDDIYQEPDIQENNYFEVEGKETKNNNEDDSDI